MSLMTSYHRGLSEPIRIASQERYALGLRVGAPLVATPGAIKDAAIRLDTDVQTMDIELGKERVAWTVDLTEQQRAMDQWWNEAWVPFYREWSEWFADHGQTWGLRNWFENFWGSSWDQVQTFREKLISLRRSAESVGFGFIAPEPAPPEVSPWSALFRFLKTAFWIVVIVGSGFLLVHFLEVSR